MRAIAFALALAIGCEPAAVWASQKKVTTEVEAAALREMAAAIPLGSRVKAQTQDGKRIEGTLMSVRDEVVIIKTKTRLPEPAVTVAFADLARLELCGHEGMSVGKMIGVGLAIGAGAIVTLVGLVAATWD